MSRVLRATAPVPKRDGSDNNPLWRLSETNHKKNYKMKLRKYAGYISARLAICVLLLSATFVKASADDALYVGEHGYINGPAYSGIMDAISWYSDRPNDIIISGNASGASVLIRQYFSGTATIECQYAYHYYSGGTKHNQIGHSILKISCRKSTVRMNKSQVELAPGEKITLKYSNSSGFELPVVMWKTDDENIATVDDGDRAYDKESVTIKAIRPGTCNIRLYGHSGDEDPVCTVTVSDLPATGISIKPRTLKVREGKKGSFSVEMTPKNASSKVSWEVDNEAVATISPNGTVTGVGEGTATVTARTDNGLSATATVVVAPQPQSVRFDSDVEIYEGYSVRLEPELIPSIAIATFKWTSDDPKIATVDADGNVKGKTQGSTTINVQTDNGKRASVRVTVKKSSRELDYRNVNIRTQAMKELINKTIKQLD